MGITFIGPSYNSIARMSDKTTAKRPMIDTVVPTVPGSAGIMANAAEARAVANDMGLPGHAEGDYGRRPTRDGSHSR